MLGTSTNFTDSLINLRSQQRYCPLGYALVLLKTYLLNRELLQYSADGAR